MDKPEGAGRPICSVARKYEAEAARELVEAAKTWKSSLAWEAHLEDKNDPYFMSAGRLILDARGRLANALARIEEK